MLPLEVAQELREKGHDVLRTSDVNQGRVDDDQILERTIAQNRKRAKWICTSYQIMNTP